MSGIEIGRLRAPLRVSSLNFLVEGLRLAYGEGITLHSEGEWFILTGIEGAATPRVDKVIRPLDPEIDDQ